MSCMGGDAKEPEHAVMRESGENGGQWLIVASCQAGGEILSRMSENSRVGAWAGSQLNP